MTLADLIYRLQQFPEEPSVLIWVPSRKNWEPLLDAIYEDEGIIALKLDE